MQPIQTTNTENYQLPDNFNIRKKERDNTCISKDEAINRRTWEIFKNNQCTLISIASVTWPIFPIWLIAYAIVRKFAKDDVTNALDMKRDELLSNTGKIGKALETAKASTTYSSKTRIEAINNILSEIDKTPEFSNYFKKSHTFTVINSTTETTSSPCQWRGHKANVALESKKIAWLISEIKKISKMTDNDFNEIIHEIISRKHPNQMLRVLTNSSEMLKIIEEVYLNEKTFQTIVTNFSTELSERFNPKPQQTESRIEDELPIFKEYCDENLVDATDKVIPLVITKHNLPIYPITLRDAKAKLPAHDINNIPHAQTPHYSALCTDEYATSLIGDDIQNTMFKKLLTSEVLGSMISLYEKITKNNPNMTPENKRKLWDILQLSLTQALINPITSSIMSRSSLLDSGFNADIMSDNRQKLLITYEHDIKNNKLSITLHQRNHYVFGGAKRYGYGERVGQCMYTKTQIKIDLRAETLDPTYEVLEVKAIPVSTETRFDQLRNGRQLNSIEEISSANDQTSETTSTPSKQLLARKRVPQINKELVVSD